MAVILFTQHVNKSSQGVVKNRVVPGVKHAFLVPTSETRTRKSGGEKNKVVVAGSLAGWV